MGALRQECFNVLDTLHFLEKLLTLPLSIGLKTENAPDEKCGPLSVTGVFGTSNIANMAFSFLIIAREVMLLKLATSIKLL